MFWNWYTVDACFLSSSWRISSYASFLGACIAVIALVVLLEFLRRLQRIYDRYIFRRAQQEHGSDIDSITAADNNDHDSSRGDFETIKGYAANVESAPNSAVPLLVGDWSKNLSFSTPPTTRRFFRPSWPQQAVRGAIYTMQFTVAYMIMLLAMYYNGYILLSIFLGVFVGFCMSSWDTFEQNNSQ